MRRYLLAGGLALMWFVQVQNGGLEGDPPAWGIAASVAVRLLADFVGAWLAVSVLQLTVNLVRLGLHQLRTRSAQE